MVDVEDVGNVAVFPAGDSAAALIGKVEYIGRGIHVVGSGTSLGVSPRGDIGPDARRIAARSGPASKGEKA